MPLVTMGAIMGGNVRVGLEDSVYLAKGEKAESNAEQVRKIRRILEELSLEIATPADARRCSASKAPTRSRSEADPRQQKTRQTHSIKTTIRLLR